MTAIAAPVGRTPISAPLPVPRQYTLLDAAREVPQANERWLGGLSSEGFVPGPASIHDPCSTGSNRIKDDAHANDVRRFGAFTVYLVGSCDAVTIGVDPTEWENRLKLSLQAVEAEAVERVFASGDGTGDFGPYLTDGNLEILTGAAVSPTEGLALLEQNIATRGGGGLIHVTPALATYWASLFLITPQRGQMVTQLGTRVVIGAGYVDAATTTTGSEYAWATGPVEYVRAQEIVPVPTNYAEAFDRSVNTVTWIVEREYVLNWVGRADASDDLHVQAGVLIDRNP